MAPLVSTLLQLAVLAADIDPPADAEWPLNRQLGAWNPPSATAEFTPPLDSLLIIPIATSSIVSCEPLLPTATHIVAPANLDLPDPVYEPPVFVGQLWGGIRQRPCAVWLGLRMSDEADRCATTSDLPLPIPFQEPGTPEKHRFHWGLRPVDYRYAWLRDTDPIWHGLPQDHWVMPHREVGGSAPDELTPLSTAIPEIQTAPGNEPANEWLPGFGRDLEKLSREFR